MTLLDAPRSRVWPVVLVGALLLLGVAPLSAGEDSAPVAGEPEPPARIYTLPDDFLERTATLPVQDGGRVKPFSSWAKFTLLQISSYGSIKTHDGRRLGPVAWALEVLFFPERAVKDEIFLIDDDQVLADLGIEVKGKRKRDRYSYEDLKPRLQFLKDKVGRLGNLIETRRLRTQDLTQLQRQEQILASSIHRFEGMLRALDVVRASLDVSALEQQKRWFAGRERVPLVEAFAVLPEMIREGKALSNDLKPEDDTPPDVDALMRTTVQISVALTEHGSGTTAFSSLPPLGDAKTYPRWFSPANVGLVGDLDPVQWLRHPEPPTELEPMRAAVTEQLQHLQAAVEQRSDRAGFMSHVDAFRESVTELAEKRNEYDRIGMEVSYYRFDPFSKALLGFIFAFLLIAFTWFSERGGKWVYRVALGLAWVSFVLVVAGITWRGLIRQRPPVSTLYETIPFITAACVLACFVIEWINRQRVAIVLGVVLGAVGMWLQDRYQFIDKKDTMPELQAVLRTNYWLWIHVTTVTIGYAAGLLTAALGHVYVLGRVFGLKRDDPGFYRNVSRMTYGALCFGLLYSVVGTIAGGVWANDSWGRFWGWDPKENGALLICLWELAILHARMGGYIKDHGLAMAAVITGPIVAFSWWGVNLLGIGLHTYGFIEGVFWALVIYNVFELAVLAAGATWWFLQPKPGQKT